MNVLWPILIRCLANPARTAIIDETRRYKAAELVVAALHLAGAIERVCTTPTLGVLIPTSGAFPIAALAGWMLGKTVVPLNYLLKPEELQYVINDCETDTVITVGPLLDFLGYSPKVPNLLRLESVSFKGFPEPRWPHRADASDLATLLYTSGTSGRPKGVMLTHGNLASNLRQVCDWVKFTRRDVMLGVLPQFHTYGLNVLTLLPLTVGIKVVYAARFVPHRIVKLLREHRPTVLVAIPSMYNALLHVKDASADDFAQLRYIVSGGEPLPEAVFAGFRDRFGVTIQEGYGLTETAPVTNWCRPHEWRPRSVGKPIPRVVERIVDLSTDEILGPNEDGEIRIAGPNVMRGYFKLPAESRAAFDGHGFFKTGDIGRLDDDGHLYITGRLKEMIIVGGENVFPREIEEVLDAHPSVAASGVIGVPNAMRGEEPVAFVELREGQAFDDKELIRWCRERLAGYKVPSEIHHLPALPRNPTGKIMRRELRALRGGTGL